MKINSLELFQVPPRWLFLKVMTEEGISGWGEPIVEGRADTVEACVLELGEYLIGKSALQIEDLWQVLYRGGFYRGGPVLSSAISGIEQALWDIKGKVLGVPVYELLGGAVRDKMRVYAGIGGDTPEEVARSAKQRMAQGYTAMKMSPVGPMEWIDSPRKVDQVVAKMAAAREAAGMDYSIAIDFHGRVHKGMAKVLIKELEPYRPLFIEEPVLAQNNEALAELSKHCSIPIATGERMFTRWDFKSLFISGIADIAQPDLSHCGGIWEARKIAAMAEAFDVAIAPHCPLGPITLASSLQLDFCTPNAFIQEQVVGVHDGSSELLVFLADSSAFTFESGFVLRPDKPGLGIEINEEKVRQYARRHKWKNPVWRNEDGCVTEW